MTATFQLGDWVWCTDRRQVGQVLEVQTTWGTTVYRLWLPASREVAVVPAPLLTPLEKMPGWSRHHIVYAAAAARIREALSRESLVAPVEGKLIPLPHQIYALSRAMSGEKVRYLLADEVGLGKTIEAGLILRELKLRGLVRRTLVVAPTGLVTQWGQEMKNHFDEEFRLVLPSDFAAARQFMGLPEGENIWRFHDQVVCSLDAVKPLDGRRGWTREQVERYNQERFAGLVAAGWDLIITDEAHRLAGSTDQVARFRLGEALSTASPYLLLLSATPHQGKTDAFRRLMALLDPDAFATEDSIVQHRVAPYVVRTEKRRAVDREGHPLFQPRQVHLQPVAWGAGAREQETLYHAVTEYVREGYNQALREKRYAVGFLMILFQRLVTSSTRAIRSALEKRLAALAEVGHVQLSFLPDEVDLANDEVEFDTQALLDQLVQARLAGIKNERTEVERLLTLARRCEAKGPDVKAEALLDLIHQRQREEQDPSVKLLVFTEFVSTQEMLAEFLRDRGFSVVCLNGALSLEERRDVQEAFRGEAQILISTDAGGEGLNLQFCHIVVNYDLPWNPMKLEQRIGRVDRIGQKKPVLAYNFSLEDSVELRVREVLEEKLQRILEEFGVDKLSDVLDSEASGAAFDDLYIEAVVNPDQGLAQIDRFADELRERAREAREGLKVLGESGNIDPALARQPVAQQLPFWTEQMTLAYLSARADVGAEVQAGPLGYRLRWPDGRVIERAVFTAQEAEAPGRTHLTLEHEAVRRLVQDLPPFLPSQPVPGIALPGISERVMGLFSLWRVVLRGRDVSDERLFPLFLSDDGRLLIPTARAVWDGLLSLPTGGVVPSQPLPAEPLTQEAWAQCCRAAEEQGAPLYEALLDRHQQHVLQERRKGEEAFAARARAIEAIGLLQVRQYRQRQLAAEREAWERSLAAQAEVWPELQPVLMVRIIR